MKTAIVTGASTGIGRATAIKMAEAGYHVFLISRSQDKLNETANLISKVGGSSTILPTDLSKLDEVNASIKTVSENADTVDAIINIAGIWHGKDEVYAGKDFH